MMEIVCHPPCKKTEDATVFGHSLQISALPFLAVQLVQILENKHKTVYIAVKLISFLSQSFSFFLFFRLFLFLVVFFSITRNIYCSLH